MNQKKSDEFTVSGDNLLNKVREVIHEGNVRRIILKREDGDPFLEIPVNAGLAVGVTTLAIAPWLVAIGAVAAMVSKVTVVVERN